MGDVVATHDTRPFLDVYNPSSGDVVAKGPLSRTDEVDAAGFLCRGRCSAWSATPIKNRVQVFYRQEDDDEMESRRGRELDIATLLLESSIS